LRAGYRRGGTSTGIEIRQRGLDVRVVVGPHRYVQIIRCRAIDRQAGEIIAEILRVQRLERGRPQDLFAEFEAYLAHWLAESICADNGNLDMRIHAVDYELTGRCGISRSNYHETDQAHRIALPIEELGRVIGGRPQFVENGFGKHQVLGDVATQEIPPAVLTRPPPL
jgi:hypothetical protein